MTSPFSIGGEVEVASTCPYAFLHSDVRKVLCHAPVEEALLKPPCSLLLEYGKCYKLDDLKSEELKIGDYAEVINPSVPNVGEIHKVIRIDASPYDGYPIQLDDFSWWGVASLRKLTPEEVAMHTGTIGYKIDEMETAMETLRELLAPLVDERLSAIEKRLDVLEGERPEVCEGKSSSFECPNNHQMPNGEPIHVVIIQGDKMHTYCDTCAGECLNFAEKVLNSMREA